MRASSSLAAMAAVVLASAASPAAQDDVLGRSDGRPPSTYVVDYVSRAAYGVDLNDAGDVVGRAYADADCGSTCLPAMETVAWHEGVRHVLPLPAGLTSVTITGMNSRGWIVGHGSGAGVPGRGLVWRPLGASRTAAAPYVVVTLDVLPGTTTSAALGIDDLGRVVGWSTTTTFPPNGSPFLWTEAGGMIDLSAAGFPDEPPLGISPGGTVATYGWWYRLGEPASIRPVPPAPGQLAVDNSSVAINDAGEQVRFLVTPIHPYLVYPFRLHSTGSWQQISQVPTGSLTTYGMGSINDAGDATLTVASTGMVAYGPTGAAQPLATLVAASYGGGAVTAAGRMNDRGEILAQMLIGRSARLVRLVPAAGCTGDCVRVSSLSIQGAGPAFCDAGRNEIGATVTVTDEFGLPVAGASVTARFLDDYWLNASDVATTDAAGRAGFKFVGPPCVGAVAVLVTSVTAGPPERTLDRTVGVLTDYVIPLPVAPGSPAGGAAVPAGVTGFEVDQPSPAPATTWTSLAFRLPGPADVRLVLFDMLGREVARTVIGSLEAGSHAARVDVSALTAGVYVFRVSTSAGHEATRLLTIAR